MARDLWLYHSLNSTAERITRPYAASLIWQGQGCHAVVEAETEREAWTLGHQWVHLGLRDDVGDLMLVWHDNEAWCHVARD